MGGILVGVLAAVRGAHQIQDLIIVVLPVCPVQAQSTLDFFTFSSGNRNIGMTGLTGCAGSLKIKRSQPSAAPTLEFAFPCRRCPRLRSFDLYDRQKKPAITGRFFHCCGLAGAY
jgi:hypothetical protein